MNLTKEYGGDLCKTHSARSEKEFCRVCPSKLNKKELENVYFTLLENNLDLKTTVNSQREQIKLLSTKVQRLTALQKTYLGKEPKDCCGSKAVIDEQKECIAELRRSNQCLSERVRQLNMRLCSAKQFLKRSPFQSTSRCNKCSAKNVSMSALITKRTDTNLRTTVASSQYLVKDIVSSRSAGHELVVSQEKGVQYDFCDENKCRNRIEELKQKNEELQEALTRLEDDHADVTGRLERELSVLRAESVRVRSDRALADERAAHARAQVDEYARRAGDAQLCCDELSVQLAIERRKVLELETRLRAADMSGRIASAIETHLANVKMPKDQSSMYGVEEAKLSLEVRNVDDNKLAVPSPQYKPKAAVRTKLPHTAPVDDTFRNSDDSGYTEPNRSQEFDDTKASTYINQVLLEKIADLQNQVNNLKAYKNDYNKPQDNLVITEETHKHKEEVYNTPIDKKKMDENIISESSESVITEKKQNITSIEQFECNGNSVIESKNDNVLDLVKKTFERKQFMSSNKLDDKMIRKTIMADAVSESKERLNIFQSRIKDKEGKADTILENRKLSLQSSREIPTARSLVKTGSLDENRINFDNGNRSTDITRNVSKKYGIANEKIDVTIIENSEYKGKSSENDNKANLYEVNIKKANDINMDENKKGDSDSSKGTYSIHRDDNVIKAETKAKDENVKGNKVDNKLIIDNAYRNDLTTVIPDIKLVENSIKTKTKDRKVQGRKGSTPSDSRTYVKARDVSPDSTDCEMSSLSDLPSERDERNVSSRSPGEERPTTTESRVTATTDYGSLSEGELPWLRDETILSAGEIRSPNATVKSPPFPMSPSLRMEDTLAAVEQELARCTSLMRIHAQRSRDAAPAD